MIQKVKARLKWQIPTAMGVLSPRGRQFTVPARFDQQGDDWTNNAWSLVVEPIAESDTQGVQQVLVRFLMPDAPFEWLVRGHRFTLHEGRMVIAEGEIL